MLTREQVFPSRVAGVMNSDDPDAAFRACVAAMEGGIGTVEVTMTVPSCLDIVHGLVGSTGGTYPIGVGGVTDAQTVPMAKQAGAAFVVTPALIPAVVDACRQEELLCVLGALTPTEVHRASMAGADVVQIFPVQAAGGPNYVRWLQGPMPGIPLLVSGGIEMDQVEEYLSVGVFAISLTTALFPPDAVARGDMTMITALARRAAAAAGTIWE